MAKRTPEEVCIEYADAVFHVRLLTATIRQNPCEIAASPSEKSYTEGSMATCLDDLFNAPKGPDGEFPRFSEYYEEMCDSCKNRYNAIQERKNARRRLGTAKRGVEAVGKRLIAVKA